MRKRLGEQASAMRQRERERLEGKFPQLKDPELAPQRALTPAQHAGAITLGRNEHGDACVLPELPRLEHMHVIGATGSGKTNFIEHCVRQDIANGRGVCVVDPHGDHPGSLYRSLLTWLAQKGYTKSRVIHLIDPNAPSHTIGFNPLSRAGTETRFSVIAEAMFEAFERMWGDEDGNTKPTIQRVMTATFTALGELGLTLAEARLLFDPDDSNGVRSLVLSKLEDSYAFDEIDWLHRIGIEKTGRRDFRAEVVGPLNRIAKLVRTEAVRAIVGQSDHLIDLREALDEGHIILANLSGGEQVYEQGADLLGRLLTRFLFFHARRRQKPHVPYFVYLDECHRYLSGDVPNLLAEIRKYGVGLVFSHQWLAQLGRRDDPVREAVCKGPNLRAVFRIKDPVEAAQLAEMVIPLDLEMPIRQLIRPTVIGHQRTSFRNASTGRQASTTNTTGTSVSDSVTETEMDSVAYTEGESSSESYSETEGESYSESVSETEGESYSGSVSLTQSSSVAVGNSQSDSRGSSESRGSSKSDSFTPLYGFINIRRDQTGSTEGDSAGETSSRGSSKSSSEVCTAGAAMTTGEVWGSSSSTTNTETFGHSNSVTRGHTVGQSSSTTTGKSKGTSKGRTVGSSSSTGQTYGTSDSSGFSEGIEPLYATLPTAVHGKENALYFAAQTLRSLKTGAAVFNYVAGEGMKATMLRVPKVGTPQLPPHSFNALRQQVFKESPSAIETHQAVAALEARERKLIGVAELRRHPPEPEPSGFRVARPKPRLRTGARSHAKPAKEGAEAVKGGPSAVAKGERDP